MEDIARSAGVTRPIVYSHFTTKEGAYIACVRRARDAFEDDLFARIDPHAHPKAQLATGAEAMFSLLEADPGRWRLLFGSNAVLPGDANLELAALRFRTIEQIRVLLAAAAPAAPPDRIEACAHAVSGVGERLGHWWLTRPDLTRAEVVQHHVDVLWAGLAPYADDPRR